VDQVEVDGEGAGDVLGPVEGPRLHQLLRLDGGVVGYRGVLVMGGDGELAQPLHVVEQALAAVLGQDHSQRVAERPDVRTQRVRHLEAGDLAGTRGGWRHRSSVVTARRHAGRRPSPWTVPGATSSTLPRMTTTDSGVDPHTTAG